jgi:hypothetical protein
MTRFKISIWRFSHLHKSGNFSTSMVIFFKLKFQKKLCVQNCQNSRKLVDVKNLGSGDKLCKFYLESNRFLCFSQLNNI